MPVYGSQDIAELAVAYEFGLSKNHPFNDANKCTALNAIRLFLKLNGYDLSSSQHEKYMTLILFAASELSESELADWVRSKITELI